VFHDVDIHICVGGIDNFINDAALRLGLGLCC
jgi:hypothetical protein